MQRYFVDFNPNESNIKITGDDFHHIKNVMRMKENDEIIVSNKKDVFYAKILQITQDHILGELLYEVKQNNELTVNVTIAQGMPKGDKFEFVIQKTTELGVNEVIPVLTSRSIVKIDEKNRGKKISRYERIAKEASEQSHRIKIPIITDFMNFQTFIEFSKNYDYKLVAYEASNSVEEINLKQTLKSLKENDKIIIFIGPEGGISDKELQQLKENGFQVVSLGHRILRTETAPLFIMSAIIYELELKG